MAKAKSIETRAKFDEAVDLISRLQVQIASIAAKRDKRQQDVAEEYRGELEPLEDKRDLMLKLAAEFAGENRTDLFPKGLKSSETTHSVFGFKIGNPTLKPLSKKWNWDTIATALETKYGVRFLRTKVEPDKDALRTELSDSQLAEVGVRVDQTDRFFVEPKVETGERVTA